MSLSSLCKLRALISLVFFTEHIGSLLQKISVCICLYIQTEIFCNNTYWYIKWLRIRYASFWYNYWT